MKVFIVTEGGNGIGFGHITRCLSLYHAFQDRGVTPEFIINSDEVVTALLVHSHYEVFDWLRERERLFGRLQGADVVIIDSYLAGHDLYNRVSEGVRSPVFFDDYNRIRYPRGIVVNGAIYAEEINYPQQEETTYLLGVRYIPLRKEFWDVREKIITTELLSVMITTGGEDTLNLTPKILRGLKKRFPFLMKKVIVAKSFTNTKEIEGVADDNTEIIFQLDAGGMKNTMLDSDVAVSAGGQTLYELARVGTPTIAFSISDDQLNNIRGWQKTGFIDYAGDGGDSDTIDKVLDCIERMRESSARTKSSVIGRRFVDGGGSKRTVDFILKHASTNSIRSGN